MGPHFHPHSNLGILLPFGALSGAGHQKKLIFRFWWPKAWPFFVASRGATVFDAQASIG